MIRTIALAAALIAATPAAGFETLAVLALGDPPGGPDADLAELTHQLRAACRDRVGGIADVPTMRARLLGQRSNATVTELDRAYGGALAVYQNGEFESAIRTLKAIVEDLESLPETDESYAQWVRAQLRLAHAALTIGRDKEADEALSAVARTDPGVQPDADQYSPSYRRRFEHTKVKVRALPVHRLHVTAQGPQGMVFVNGRPMGTTPLVLSLPAGTYRIGGSAGSLHVPSFRVDLQAEDGNVVLDFALAEALRVHAGPGLALALDRRGHGIVRAGAWLGVDRVITVSRGADGDARFLLGSIYDVRNGSLLREGSVRMTAGSVPAANLGALAAFLLTGQSSRDVVDRTELARAVPIAETPAAPRDVAPAAGTPSLSGKLGAATVPAEGVAAVRASGAAMKRPVAASAPASPKGDRPASAAASAPAASPKGDRPSANLAAAPHSFVPPALPVPAPRDGGGSAIQPRHRWMRPAAYASAILCGVFTGVAIQQGLSAHQASADAEAMLGPDGVLAPGSDPGHYRDLRDESRAASRNAYVSGGAAIVFAATAGILGWKSRAPAGPPALALRF